MKTKFLLITIFLFPFIANAQWESMGDDIIPVNHRVWSIKIAPDKSFWAIPTLDAFPPENQVPKVHRSIDEGATWEDSELQAGISTFGWDISPVNQNVAYVALDSAGLHRTTDGGQTWNEVTSFPSTYAYMVHFFNENDGWIFAADDATSYLSMVLTADGGNTWTKIGGNNWDQPTGTSLPDIDLNEFLPGFTFSMNSGYDYNDNEIIIGTSKGTVWKSNDKGYNWTRQDTPLVNLGRRSSNIAMKDSTTYMVSGDIISATNAGVSAVNFTTTDNGATWIEGASGVTAAATHYIPDSDSIFIAVGHNNFGWGNTGTAISYNYGETWEIIHGFSLIAIDFLDSSTGVGACCNNIWFTANGQIHKWNFDLPTSIKKIVDSEQIDIMPNPASNFLRVEMNETFSKNEIFLEINSINGQTIFHKKYFNSQEIIIPISFLPKGIYSLHIFDDKKSVIKKFIKE